MEHNIIILMVSTGTREDVPQSSYQRKATCFLPVVFPGQAEGEATLREMRSLRERLSNSERAVDALKSNMSSMVTQRDQVHSELHQARLQAAQLTLQLADCSLALREGRAHWAQERQAMQRDAEVPGRSGSLRHLVAEPAELTHHAGPCPPQKDQEQLAKLAGDVQRVEEELQEERMERVKLEVELGREKDCNRVRSRVQVSTCPSEISTQH